MAKRNTIMPSQRAPFVGEDRRVDPVWYRFLFDLHERTGGGADDKVELSAGAAETAIVAAAAADAAAVAADAAAVAAQQTADNIDARFDFNLDLDLR